MKPTPNIPFDFDSSWSAHASLFTKPGGGHDVPKMLSDLFSSNTDLDPQDTFDLAKGRIMRLVESHKLDPSTKEELFAAVDMMNTNPSQFSKFLSSKGVPAPDFSGVSLRTAPTGHSCGNHGSGGGDSNPSSKNPKIKYPWENSDSSNTESQQSTPAPTPTPTPSKTSTSSAPAPTPTPSKTSTSSAPAPTPTPSKTSTSSAPTPTPSKTSTTETPTPSKTTATSSSKQSVGSTAGMEGFAKLAGTTGGAGGKTVTVNTVNELKAALQGDEPTVIKLGQNLSAAEKTILKFGANKTLVGDGKNNQLHNIYLRSGDTASNDIFQNLHFTHDAKYTGNDDIPLYIDKGKGYWIDHNTFTGGKGPGYQGGKDKLLYVGGTADMVSLTNSKFEKNEYGLLLGYYEDTPEAAAKYTGYPRMTIAHNDFENLDVRAPGLMRYGQFDVYNNHINNFNLGFTAHTNATIFSQSNFFENGRDGGGNPGNTGALRDIGSVAFTDIGSNVDLSNRNSKPTDWRGGNYQRHVSSAAEAKAFTLANAGAQDDGTLTFAS